MFVIAVLALAMVTPALTAVWSSDKERRKDALAVFDRMTRWRWQGDRYDMPRRPAKGGGHVTLLWSGRADERRDLDDLL